MAVVTALVDIGPSWPAGESRDVPDGRAVLMANSGWVSLAVPDLVPEKPAEPATNIKE